TGLPILLPGGTDEEACKDVSWWHPNGRELREDEWNDPATSAFGMLLCGSALKELDQRGRVQEDDSLLIVFHGHGGGEFVLPPVPDAEAWRPALCTGTRPCTDGQPLPAGTRIRLEERALTAFEAVPAA